MQSAQRPLLRGRPTDAAAGELLARRRARLRRSLGLAGLLRAVGPLARRADRSRRRRGQIFLGRKLLSVLVLHPVYLSREFP